MSAPLSVAVIQHRRFLDRDTGHEWLLVASAVDGVPASTEWQPVADEFGGRERVVEKFLEMWAAHGDGGLVLYVADPLIRGLLTEQSQLFPGLIVRDVVSGERLTRTWQCCRDAFEEQRLDRFPGNRPRPEPKDAPPLVIATDASRGSRGKLTGLGIATSAGHVQLLTVRTDTILAGEFAAVDAALSRYWSRTWTIDILTDSQKVWARLNGDDLLGARVRSQEETRCVQRVWDLRRKGVTVRVHWVRGHNGHVLNEFADRAAVAARREAQWGIETGGGIAGRLRAELHDALADCGELVPGAESRDYRAAA